MQLQGGWGAMRGYFAPPSAVAVVNHCNYNSSGGSNNNIVNYN